MGKFIGGFICGILATIFLSVIVSSSYQANNRGLNMLEKPGDCIGKEPLKIFQVIEPDLALASERSNREYNWYHGKTVMVMNKENKTYYDEQIIKANKCFRQVGTYQYETRAKDWKTVPVVIAE